MKYTVVLMALLGKIAASELTHHHHHYSPIEFVESADGDNMEAKPKKKDKKAKKAKKGKKGGKKSKSLPPIVPSGDGGKWTPSDSRKTFEQHVANAAAVVKTQEAFEAK